MRSWSDAEPYFEFIKPVIGNLTKKQVNELADIIVNGYGNVLPARKYLTKFLPDFLYKCRNKISQEKKRALNKIININKRKTKR